MEQFSETISDFQTRDAYVVQALGLAFREKNGEALVGWKMGLTSEAKRQQMNLHSPLYGGLTDKMALEDGGEFQLKNSIHPKVEPEVAFLMGEDLSYPTTREKALEAVSAVCPALEILDSRYKQFKYFSLQDVIADNSSSSHFVLGNWREDFSEINLADLAMEMTINGETAGEGNSNAISGDPIISVVQLVELLHENGQTLKAGQVVLAGGATSAVALEPNMKVQLEVEGLGSVGFQVGE